MLKNQVGTFLLELMDKRFSLHSHLVSIAHYISNKVSGLIRPLHHIPVRFPVGNKHKTDSSSSYKKKMVWSGGFCRNRCGKRGLSRAWRIIRSGSNPPTTRA
ncbi:hypothetical protein DXU84_24715 [Rahnella sp. RcJ3]|nr:hypothetical protein [Rahnella sp. RcJ3]